MSYKFFAIFSAEWLQDFLVNKSCRTCRGMTQGWSRRQLRPGSWWPGECGVATYPPSCCRMRGVKTCSRGRTLDSRRRTRRGGTVHGGCSVLYASSTPRCYRPCYAIGCLLEKGDRHPWVLTSDASPDFLIEIYALETSSLSLRSWLFS